MAMTQAYSPPLSLWHLVEQHVPESEQDEVKNMLGDSLVDQSLELHAEIEMLLDIWRDMQDESCEVQTFALPEPPHQRERLVQEICFFVEGVKERAKNKGVDPHHILRHHNSDVLEYAKDAGRPGSALKTHRSERCDTPLMRTSPDRVSLSTEVVDEVEAANSKLNFKRFNEVCTNLQSTLEKEVEQLLKDIEFLQSCLSGEAACGDSPLNMSTFSREPTLLELREERSALEKELFLTESLTSTPDVRKPSFDLSPLKLTPRGDLSVTAAPCTSLAHPKETTAIGPTPMKADHSLDLKTVLKSPPVSNKCDNIPTVLQPKSSPKQFTASATLTPSPPPVGATDSRTEQHYSTNGASNTQNELSKRNLSRRRKLISPARIKVVDVSTIFNPQASSKDTPCSNIEYSGINPSCSSFPSSSVGLSDQEPKVRPPSAHADRFRRMVMTYRDED